MSQLEVLYQTTDPSRPLSTLANGATQKTRGVNVTPILPAHWALSPAHVLPPKMPEM